MCRNYIYSSVKITHIYCYSITLKMCTSHVQPMYTFAVWPWDGSILPRLPKSCLSIFEDMDFSLIYDHVCTKHSLDFCLSLELSPMQCVQNAEVLFSLSKVVILKGLLIKHYLKRLLCMTFFYLALDSIILINLFVCSFPF